MNEETQRARVYEIYTSDALRYLLQSITKAYGGMMPKYRYAELIGLTDPPEEIENPEKKAEEIIDKFLADLGGGNK